MINIKTKKNCTGCYACYNICPKGCINMEKDNEGFVYPHINTEICIKCNKCEKVCPILHPYPRRKFSPLNIYASINPNPEIRNISSSGGVFYAIAKTTLKNNGIIYGAAFDKKWNVYHTSVNNLNDIRQLLGSKYIQSNINNAYKEIKDSLKQGKMILFCGTPCQITALNHYLAKKYDNLFTAELLCHGVPSTTVWEIALKEILSQNHINQENISYISFRKKVPNMTEYKFSIQEGLREYETFFYNFPFMKAFLSNLILRPSCYKCKAKQHETESDVIIGDLWNSYNHAPYNDSKGTSIIIVNTQKGEELITSSDLKITPLNKKYINKNNSGFQIHQFYNTNRKKFFKEINTTNSILELMDKYSRLGLKEKIMRKILKMFLSCE